MERFPPSFVLPITSKIFPVEVVAVPPKINTWVGVEG
jgi:hypothetical protein